VRLPNGFGWVPDGLGSALAGAAPQTEPRTIAALTSNFVIIFRGSFHFSSLAKTADYVATVRLGETKTVVQRT
jgi:hypothetical protein